MDFREFLKNNIVVLDGATGTYLQKRGLKITETPESWTLTNAGEIINMHKAYFDAGSNLVCANTFGVNGLKYDDELLETLISRAMENVKKARELSCGKQEKFVGLDVGGLGRLLKPFGDLDFERAVEIYAKSMILGEKYGAEVIFIQTMTDSFETKAAVLAAKENTSLPIIASNAYGLDGKLLTGADTLSMVAMLEGLGVSALGANCSFGPKDLLGVVDELVGNSSIPVSFKPNAGLPKVVDGKTVYDVSVEEFVEDVMEGVRRGARLVGGCCGTTPEYIAKLSAALKGVSPKEIKKKELTVVSSYSKGVKFGGEVVLIGERINPTGKKKFKAALVDNDINYVLQEGIREKEAGAHVLDVNVGIPEINEEELLPKVVFELQAICDLPLQIDTSNKTAMEKVLRIYNGKALINSVNGKEKVMSEIFPLAKKYGGVVIALTLDEDGIPETAEGRIKIAEKILNKAKEFGIEKKDIIFDPLCLSISADKNAADVTLAAVKGITERLGAKTSLGISNVSFGLPDREKVNAAFFSLAVKGGLSAAIINPFSLLLMEQYYLLTGKISAYGASLGQKSDEELLKNAATYNPEENGLEDLKSAVKKGLKQKAKELCGKLLETVPPLTVINEEIIPALDEVGKGFENKTVFLPQLLMSAEAAKEAFLEVKEKMPKKASKKCDFVLATVEGDIHDIGKNIVKLLLENYGFSVIDLGKDVKKEVILDAVLSSHAPLLGLSALMTTTVPNMEKTIELVHEKAPFCKIIVGGAVLTASYAKKINADAYGKDAMETVRYAEKVYAEIKKGK